MKTKTYLIIIACFLTAVISCKKYKDLSKDDPLHSPSYLYGRLFLTDTLTQNQIGSPLANKIVTVTYSDATDKTNYLFSTTTDANGYFKFNNLNSERTYVVSYAETVGGKLFSATSSVISLPQETLVLVAGLALTGQTGIFVKVQDATGKAVSGASICIASSPAPSNNNTCDGSNYSLSADGNGHASQFTVPPGTYYIFSKLTINNVIYTGKQTVTITNKVELQTITLTPPINVTNNGLNILLLDKNGNPINSGTVCLFSSRLLFARDTCEGSSYSIATDVSGKGSLVNLNPGKYFILGQVALKGLKLLAKDSLQITNKVITDTLRLK